MLIRNNQWDVLLSSLVLIVLSTQTVHAQLGTISTPISGYHGNTATCSDCHFGGTYTGSASFSVPATVPHNTTTSGQAFTFNQSTNAPGWGFNIAIYNPANTKVVGGYSNLSSHINAGQTGGELQHFSRQTASTNPQFDWTAPTATALSDLGTYTVYGCLNQVNGDDLGFTSGDGPPVCTSTTFSVINNNPDAVDDTQVNLAVLAVSEDGTTGTFNVLSNDTQTEGDSFTWFSTNTTGLTGSLTDNSDGTFNYNPNNQYEALDTGETASTSFTYTIREVAPFTSYTDTATVTIEIQGANDAPVAVDDGTSGFGNGFVTVNEGATINTGLSVLTNDSDVDIESITATQTGCSPAATSPMNDVAFTLNTNGTFSYTHDGTNTTSDSFSYCASDGTTVSNTVTVYIDVTAVNDPPAISDFSGSVAYSEQSTVVLDGAITIADSDSSNLNDATMQITGGFASGEDSLSCSLPLPSGITSCNFSGDSLSISGVASLANYETVIEGVTFTNSSDNPNQSTKTVSLNVRDSALSSSSTVTRDITPINRLNDPPTIAAIADQITTENTTADPNTFTITAVASDIDVDDDTNTGNGTITYTLVNALSGMTISNSASNPGEISWQPTQTGTFNQAYGPITVEVEDGDEDGSAPISVQFNITVSPPDTDGDGIANYNDLCLTIADPTNADNDGDGTPGSDGGTNDGGDVCDADDDNDGMPDSFENTNGFDPFDAADALLDTDGDGVSNLDEFQAGTSPIVADFVIDATGYLTPVALNPPEPVTINAAATSVTATSIDLNGVTLAGFNPLGPFRPGKNEITWAAFDSNNVIVGSTVQTLTIRPLMNFSTDQFVGEGSTVTVNATLNGVAAAYPVTVSYGVAGTADVSDHNATSGNLTFTSPNQASSFTFDVTADASVELDETVILTATSATNAALGSNATHTVTITEDNILPQVELSISQNAMAMGSAFVSEGNVTVDVIINDVNAGQSHVIDWSSTDNSLSAPTDSSTLSWGFTPVVGNFLIDVTVTDNGSPALSNRISRILNISATAPTLLNTDDSDSDGTDDMVEGLGDSDADGIPDYLDANSEGNLLPNQTVNLTGQYIIETEPGLTLALGNTTMAANNFGVLLTDADIESFGSQSGGVPLNAEDGFEHVGGVYDFEITGLIPGASASIVIPLESSIPHDAVYRKFDAATGWRGYVVDSNNRIASAPGEPGACPEPGSNLYVTDLNLFDNCLQLTIEDGGPNDIDGVSNGVIKDPGSVAVQLEDPETPTVKKGGGQLNPWMLIIFMALGGLLVAIQKRRKEFNLG